MMLRKTLIAAALTALAAPAAAQGAAQEAEDFTARLNRMPAQAAPPAPEPEPEPEPAAEPESDPTPAPEDDFTARLNRAPAAETPLPPPEPEPQAPPAEASSEPPILEGLSEQLRRMRPAPEDEADPEPEPGPEPGPVEPEPVEPGRAPDEPDAAPEPDAPEPDARAGAETEPEAAAGPAPESARESPPPPALEILSSQAGLAFRVDVPPAFDLVERPSGPNFDVYQVSRGDVPFVGIYVGCCSPFPIYDGRRVEAAGRLSILVQEDGANRAVEHLFVRESDGRQIHVWLHSVTGEDRAIAERIAQTVDPR